MARKGLGAWLLRVVSDPISLFTLALVVFTWLLQRSTDKLWKSGEDAHKATERAFVSLDGFNFEITTAAQSKLSPAALPDEYRGNEGLYMTRFAVQPRWKNSGNTPTKRLRIQINWRGPPLDIPPSYEYQGNPIPFFIAPGAIEPGEVIEMPGAQAIIKWGMTMMGIEPIFLIWGRADYEDVYGKPHFIQWCHRLRFERIDGKTLRASTFQWGDYNRTEDT